jgi:hypothetical protein
MVTANDSATLTESSRLDAVRSFDFYVTGLEDGMIAALQHSCLWAKTVTTYAGELDEVAIREGLARLVNRMPLILVTYGQGEDVQAPGVGAIAASFTPGTLASTLERQGGPIAIANLKPRVFQHNCLFSAIIVSNDTRGELARRRAKTETGATIPGAIGLYQMMGEVKAAVDDLQFYVIDPTADKPVRLNTQPFKPVAVDYMAKLPDITAYAVHWETAFKYRTPDRTPQYPKVKDLIVDVTNTESFDNTHPGAPGAAVELDAGDQAEA